jgi:hypothetical protein
MHSELKSIKFMPKPVKGHSKNFANILADKAANKCAYSALLDQFAELQFIKLT